jgi:hypothetical protein
MAANSYVLPQTSTPAQAGKRGRSQPTIVAGAATKGLETEKGFLQAIRDLARILAWTEYHTYSSMHSSRGFPDLVLIRPPCIIFAEVKTEKGRVTITQQEWIDMLKRCPGVEVYIWRPEHWSEIVERLKA